MLTNPIYIGKIDFKNQIYDGEHDAIVGVSAWEDVQHILQQNGRNGGAEVRSTDSALLKGLARCASCHAAMIRTYLTKNSHRSPHYTCAEAQQRGRGECENKPVSEYSIKAVVNRQIRRIGSDPRIVAAVVAKVHENRPEMMVDLNLEHQAAQRELATLGTKLLELLSNAGCGEQTMTEQMADLHQRIDRIECRSREILREIGSIEDESVGEADLGTALAQFEPVWGFLNSREQARIVRTLIEHIDYSGKTNRVTVSFRSRGVRGVCRGREDV